MKHTHAVAALSAVAIACGGNSPATSHNNPGTGSSTLKVTGDIDGSISSGNPLTSFTVTVKDGAGNNVSGATVVVLNPSLSNGGLPLVEATPASGRYTNSVAQFPSGDFELSVTHPSGNVQGVVVGGPGMHTINAPTVNSTMPANQPGELDHTDAGEAGDGLDAGPERRERAGHRRLHDRGYTESAERQPARVRGALQRGGRGGRTRWLASACHVHCVGRPIRRAVTPVAGP